MKMTEVIRARIDHMTRLYELSGGVSHDGEMGAFREFFTAELIRPILPNYLGVGSGIVVGRDGRQSPQLDLIVFDRRSVPPLLAAGDRGIYPLDAVLAICEVKSTLTAADYRQATSAAKHFHPSYSECLTFGTTRPDKEPTYPLCAVFGYTSDAKDKPETERLGEQCPQEQGLVRLIAVLGKGLWLWNDGNGAYEAEPNKDRVGEMFVLHLLNRLDETALTRSAFRLQDWIT